MRPGRWLPAVFAAGVAAGLAAAWLDLADLRARLAGLGGVPCPPPRRVGLGPYGSEQESGW